jgi:acetyltransferase-like isoleucine patch superfamily enzyme
VLRSLLKIDDSAHAASALRRKLLTNRGRPRREAARRAAAFVAETARARLQLRHVTAMGVGVRVLGLRPLIHNRGVIRLGNDVVLESRTRRIYLNVWPGGELVLDDAVVVNDGVRFDCTSAIRVGKRALVGYGVVISDNHFHGLYDRGARPAGAPVTLEDDVWVAGNAMILAGVTVGQCAVVAAGAVVREDVAPYTVVAGNPARVVQELDPEKFRRGDGVL